jgi:hypothetical protein
MRIFGPMRDEETGGWRKVQNEVFLKLYSLLIMIRMVKLRRVRWMWHIE